jgi:hypothetical protein
MSTPQVRTVVAARALGTIAATRVATNATVNHSPRSFVRSRAAPLPAGVLVASRSFHTPDLSVEEHPDGVGFKTFLNVEKLSGSSWEEDGGAAQR